MKASLIAEFAQGHVAVALAEWGDMKEKVELWDDVNTKLLQSLQSLESLLHIDWAVHVVGVSVEGGVPHLLEGPQKGQERPVLVGENDG